MATIAELEQKVEKLARELAELRSGGMHKLNAWERDEVQKGLADRLATDEEVQAVFGKYGLQNTL